MALPSSLVSQFVKITKDETPTKSESIVYGTAVKSDGATYVKFDGSELLTPATFATNIEDGERVTVMIKNHAAVVTGNITSPAARTAEVESVSTDLSKFKDDVANVKILIANKVSTDELEAQKARIDKLEADYAVIGDLEAENVTVAGLLKAVNADIDNLKAKDVEISGKLTANEADIDNLKAKDVEISGKLTANEADIDTLKAKDVEISGKLTANEAEIDRLDTEKLSADSADIKYANIDFANIGEAAFEYFYSKSGLIDNVVIGDGTITGNLVGVTIKGDLIEGGTVIADKLVVKGEDGLYYKLNTDGVTTEAEQTEYNSLDGSVITAKSITATKISVDDLVAFDATIGGFNITADSLYSGVKSTVDNTTRGIYLDKDGQFAIGDSDNYLKFYRDTDGSYKLELSIINEVKNSIDELATGVTVDEEGVHVHKPGYLGKNEVFIDENSMDIKMNGTVYSSFTRSYVQFGNYQLRKTADGGLAFRISEV